MARANLLAFAEAPVDALLHAGRPEGERHHADQQALRQQVEAERKAQEADLIEWSGEGHHGEHCGKNDDERGDGKDERLPAVTIASGLFRHRSSPSRSAWPPSSYQLRYLWPKGGARNSSLVTAGFGLTPKHGKLEA